MDSGVQEEWIVGVPARRGDEHLQRCGLQLAIMRVEQGHARKFAVNRRVETFLAKKNPQDVGFTSDRNFDPFVRG